MRLTPFLLAFAALPALAAGTTLAAVKPEIERATAPPQATGAAHTLRTIPEACARLEGMFTGRAAVPYEFAVVRTSPNCQPRARFVDAAKANPSEASGWKLNDLIRVPNAACQTQHAVIRVWRKPVDVATPDLDGQGQARIYLQESRQAAAASKTPMAVTVFAAAMAVEGVPCP